MKRSLLLIIITVFHVLNTHAQKDTARKDGIYSEVDYAELFDELESFIDSLTRPRSFAMVNIGAGKRMFHFNTNSVTDLTVRKSLTLSPSVGYFDKSGFGINFAAALVNEDKSWNPYQFSGTASWDYLKNTNFLTGVSYTRYITKDSLNFYTSPLKNEVFGHFSYRKSFVKPSLSASYGWGSRTEMEERKWLLGSLIKEKKEKKEKKKKNNGRENGNGNGNGNNGNNNDVIEYIDIIEHLSSVESIRDLNLSLSFRHDFYWLDVFVSDDFVRFSPQLSFTGGTQNYGFNQSLNIITSSRNLKGDLFPISQQYSLDEKTKFQPISLTAFLKTEFSKGKFFFQPQMMFDYYFPESDKKLTTNFVVNSGFLF